MRKPLVKRLCTSMVLGSTAMGAPFGNDCTNTEPGQKLIICQSQNSSTVLMDKKFLFDNVCGSL